MRTLPLVVVLIACGPPPAPSSLKEYERVVVVSDLVASSPTYSTGFVSLLKKNDDALFPMFAGKDLSGHELVRVDRPGEGFTELASADLFTNDGSKAGTAVIVELGANDLFSVFFQLYSSATLRADPQPVIDEFRVSVHAVLAKATDRKVFWREPKVFVTNVPDPSDGVGDIATLVAATFPLAGRDVTVVTPELTKRVLGDINAVIADETSMSGATLVDLHAAFMGHGFHATETTLPAYVAADPTKWFRSFVDANRRGAHELRRVMWKALSSEDIAEIPTGLPAELPSGLPAVPARGWANAIVEANVAKSIKLPSFGDAVLPNNEADPAKCLGPSDGFTDGAVAIGVLGNFITVDLGEGEEATDGAGDDLVVLEQGRLSGGVPERYRVSLASSASGPWTVLAEGAGEQAFDLSGSGVSSARFVKLESLVRLSDIDNGLGSPFAPGPEIDAIGAVHPAGE